MVEGLRPCPTCGAPVAPGRLSCPSCGTLLASVSGRAEVRATGDEGPPAAQPAPPAASTVRPPDPSRPAPSVLHPVSEREPEEPSARRGAAGTPLPAYTSIPAAATGDGELATNQWYSMRSPQQAAVAGRPDPAVDPGRFAPADTPPATAGVLSDLPFRAPATMAAWIAAVGSFIAGAAVVLPWRATPGLPYLTIWGAAMPSVVVAAIVALVAGLIAITPSRLAPRLRWGFVPFFVGAFGVGGAWMWQSLYAADIGLWVYLGGSIVAAVVGALSLSGWAEPTSR